jgi:hypothetical protein
MSVPGEASLGVAAAAIMIAAASNNIIKGIYALALLGLVPLLH